MDVKIGFLSFLVLGATWACDARQLTESGGSFVPQEGRVVDSKEFGRNDKCTLCEEFAAQAIEYLGENKTQSEIIDALHATCSHTRSFEQQCITLVDYYAPLFFLEVAIIKPADLCRRVDICRQQTTAAPPPFNKDCCELCHYATAEVLLKLKDPDTQLEILELLLKGCEGMENHTKKCKRMVFEYGPVIISNAEHFLETAEICTALHACNLTNSASQQLKSLAETPAVSDS